MKEEVKELQSEGPNIILALDENEPITNISDIGEFAASLGLVDAITYHHRFSSQPIPATYNRGSKKVDLVFLSRRLLQALLRRGLDPFGQLIPYIDLEQLLGGTLAEMGAMPIRHVDGKDPRAIIPFREALYKYVADHRIVERALKLERLLTEELDAAGKEQLTKAINAIDRDLTRGFTCAGKKCARKFSTTFTPKVLKARRKIQYFKSLESELRTGIDLS